MDSHDLLGKYCIISEGMAIQQRKVYRESAQLLTSPSIKDQERFEELLDTQVSLFSNRARQLLETFYFPHIHVPTVDVGDVEHFFPQSDNALYSLLYDLATKEVVCLDASLGAVDNARLLRLRQPAFGRLYSRDKVVHVVPDNPLPVGFDLGVLVTSCSGIYHDVFSAARDSLSLDSDFSREVYATKFISEDMVSRALQDRVDDIETVLNHYSDIDSSSIVDAAWSGDVDAYLASFDNN